MVPDTNAQPLETGIWYPSDAPASLRRLGPYTRTVAVGGEVAGRGLPLVVMSPGSFQGHYGTALALAEAGFVVAAITHTGDTEIVLSPSRPRQIKAPIDYMLGSWSERDRLDPMRIGIFGFSGGGFTALVAIGGVPDLSLGPAYCAAHPDDWGCRRARETETRLSVAPADFVHDSRIAAAVIAAPGIGWPFTTEALAGITAPIQLWRGDSDEILPHPHHAQHVYDGPPIKSEHHVVTNARHFAFWAPCTPALAMVAAEACRDPAGFDRAAFHRAFNPAVVAFFNAKLRP
jgi:predicted dienelactone hydrolase